ncbi:holin family protein [Liquorilactobacillus ghanensis]|uniref:phage holin family protein n=1 Tax=Liquorilactobacillus ghanensis TaxID=399370 RepID=UPI0039E96488
MTANHANLILLKYLISVLGMFLGWYLGGMDHLIYVLLTFVCLDYLSGLFCAISQHRLSSKIGFNGITKKILIFILIGAANLLDSLLLRHGSSLRTAAIFFYLANEGISLLENAGQLGVPIPAKLRMALTQLNKKDAN